MLFESLSFCYYEKGLRFAPRDRLQENRNGVKFPILLPKEVFYLIWVMNRLPYVCFANPKLRKIFFIELRKVNLIQVAS